MVTPALWAGLVGKFPAELSVLVPDLKVVGNILTRICRTRKPIISSGLLILEDVPGFRDGNRIYARETKP